MINMQSSGSLHLSPLAFQTLQQLIELKTLHALPGQHKKHAKLPINFYSYVLISAFRNFSLLQSPDYRLEQRIIFDRRDRPQWVRYEEKLVVLVVITKCAIFSRDITAYSMYCAVMERIRSIQALSSLFGGGKGLVARILQHSR